MSTLLAISPDLTRPPSEDLPANKCVLLQYPDFTKQGKLSFWILNRLKSSSSRLTYMT
jgi:hypothetical protein